MTPRILELKLAEFERIATLGGDRPEPLPYEVDVFLAGGAGYNSAGVGTACMITGKIVGTPDSQTGTVRVDVTQYGQGNDFNACYIDCEAIMAVRMRKP